MLPARGRLPWRRARNTHRLAPGTRAAGAPEGGGVARLYAAIEAADGRLEGIKKDLTSTIYKAVAVGTTVILAAIGVATSIILAALPDRGPRRARFASGRGGRCMLSAQGGSSWRRAWTPTGWCRT